MRILKAIEYLLSNCYFLPICVAGSFFKPKWLNKRPRFLEPVAVISQHKDQRWVDTNRVVCCQVSHLNPTRHAFQLLNTGLTPPKQTGTENELRLSKRTISSIWIQHLVISVIKNLQPRTKHDNFM